MRLTTFVHSAQIQTSQAISIFLQIRLDGSNYHIFPPCFTQMKWKSRGRARTDTSARYNFLHFSQQYTVHIMARSEKNRAGFFSCARVRIRLKEFSPSNICLYTIAATMHGSEQAWRLESAVGISCLWWMWKWLKSAQVAQHGYDAICAHNLFAVYHIGKLPANNRTSFYNGKMCECTQIFHVKMWCYGWMFIWQMWMIVTLILIWIVICA